MSRSLDSRIRMKRLNKSDWKIWKLNRLSDTIKICKSSNLHILLKHTHDFKKIKSRHRKKYKMWRIPRCSKTDDRNGTDDTDRIETANTAKKRHICESPNFTQISA